MPCSASLFFFPENRKGFKLQRQNSKRLKRRESLGENTKDTRTAGRKKITVLYSAEIKLPNVIVTLYRLFSRKIVGA